MRLSHVLTTTLAAGALAVTAQAGIAQADDERRGDDHASAHATSHQRLYFERGGAHLDRAALTELDRVGQWLKEGPERRLIIDAHEDGARDGALARQRAAAIERYLVSQGVSGDRISVRAGASEPAGDPREAELGTAQEQPPAVVVVVRTRDTNRVVRHDRRQLRSPQEREAEAELRARQRRMAQERAARQALPARPERTAERAEQRRQQELRAQAMRDGAAPATEPLDYRVSQESFTVVTEESPRPVVGLQLGGGVTGFTDGSTRDYADEGGAWDARVVFGARNYLAMEVAYVGSAQSIDALGLDADTTLVGHRVEGGVRLNAFPDGALNPYAFGGFGYGYYSLVGDNFNTSNVSDSDNVVLVPVGVGVSAPITRSLVIDVRGTYRATYSEDLIGPTVDDDFEEPGLDTWAATAQLGWIF